MAKAAIRLDGRALAAQSEAELAARVARLRQAGGAVPILATLLVGNDPASATYVRMKASACQRIGMESRRVELPEDTTTDDVLRCITQLNADPNVHGILLQHPVPAQVNERACFDAIAVEKDVDGVTCLGYGRTAMGVPAWGAATPRGIMRLLAAYDIPLAGRHAVVVGRSPILGKPMAAMLLNADATVTVCHSKTVDLPAMVARADILVATLGRPEYIRAAWVKEGAVVVDAGYHPEGVGDVELAPLATKAYACTPVPGGVGPMTINTLIQQTVAAGERRLADG